MAFRSADSTLRKPAHPPEDTHQEAAYLKSLGEKQKPVRVKLMDGEVIRGWIEYYDRRMIRLTRDGAPNLFIYKHDIAYIAEEGPKTRRVVRSAADGALTPESADSNE